MARFQSTMIGSFPEFAGDSVGGPSYPCYPVINDAPLQQTPNAPAQIGDILVDRYGFQYAYVRAVAALAQGQVCKYAGALAGTVSAATTSAVINTNITTTLNESILLSFLACSGNTGTPFIKIIKGQTAIGTNTQFTISKLSVLFGLGGARDGDNLSFTPTTGDAVAVVRAYSVDVAGIADSPVGVALGTVTAGNRTLIQVSGLAQVLAVGSTDALADNGPAVTAAAGVVKGTLGTATAASAVAESKSIVGTSKVVWAGASKLQAIFLGNLADKW